MPGNATLVLLAISAAGGRAGPHEIRLRVNRELKKRNADQLSAHGVGQLLIQLATEGMVTKKGDTWMLTGKGRMMP